MYTMAIVNDFVQHTWQLCTPLDTYIRTFELSVLIILFKKEHPYTAVPSEPPTSHAILLLPLPL